MTHFVYCGFDIVKKVHTLYVKDIFSYTLAKKKAFIINA